MARTASAALTALLLVTAGPGGSGALSGQGADSTEVAEARQFIAEGAYEPAARELVTYLNRHPDDVGIRWLLARTLYWSGDHGAARRELRRVLDRDPGYGPALDLWREMRVLWAPRVRIEGELHSDDQPLDRQRMTLEAELPLSAHVAVLAGGRAGRLDAHAPGDVGIYEGRGGLRASPAGAPIEVELRGGVHARPALDRSEFVGMGRLSLRLPERVEAGLEVRRWAYGFTAAAVDTAVLVETVEAELSRGEPTGVGGALGGRIDGFPGGNEVRHAWAWLLAPVWSDGRSAVRLGYAFQYQDADTTTFRLAGDGGAGGPPGGLPGPPGGGPGGAPILEGEYDPYYTPENARAHVALAAVRAALSPEVALSADGGIGMLAREEAPDFVADTAGGTAGDPMLRFEDRDYTPWRIRGRLAAELSTALTLRLEAAYREEAFFRTGSASANLEWRFLGGLERP